MEQKEFDTYLGFHNLKWCTPAFGRDGSRLSYFVFLRTPIYVLIKTTLKIHGEDHIVPI
jgi:hypothetical protein